MTARSFKMYPPISRASKPKGKGWDRVQRFATGHDAGCFGLLPEEMRLNDAPMQRRRKVKTMVYRSATFGMTREHRIIDDALFLLNRGFVGNLEEALERALKNNPEPGYSSK